MQPLKGITVVTLEHAIAAPFATRQLADMGARVIKIERPGVGDFARGYDERVRGLASHFVWTNRSKESLTLDVKHAEAQKILMRLILEDADVVVQNLAPGAAGRLGLSYAALSKQKPGIILCDISGYGSDGPYRDKKAYDLLIQSESGLVSVTGTPETPSKAGNSIADIAAGMYAYSNIMAALMHRQQTGQGQCIDVSMLESLAEWMGYPLYYAYDGADAPARTGASHATIFPYGPFPAGDGKIVMLGLQNEREWKIFCDKVLLQPNLAADERFSSNAKRSGQRELLTGLIVQAFASMTALQLAERLFLKEGYSPIVTDAPQAALQIARTVKPTAIFLDIMMPGFDGWDVLAALKADPVTQEIPVFMISIAADRQKCQDRGAAGVVVKPLDGSKVKATMVGVKAMQSRPAAKRAVNF